MGKLAEFIRTEAAHIHEEMTRREGQLSNWLSAIARLNEMLSEWVRWADAGHKLLEVVPTAELTRQEALLGIYTVRGLSITFGGRLIGRSAEVVPRARYVAARIRPPGEEIRRADGTVEIKSGGGGSADYYLYRLAGPTPEDDRWFIRNLALWNENPENENVDVLDRDRFEAAVLQILR